MTDTRAVAITIPEGLEFSALRLSRDPVTHEVEFEWTPIERICEASGLDVSVFRDQHEDNVAGLITAWYMEHRRLGGAPDPVQEQILAEVQAEDALGQYRVQAGPPQPQ